ncbi:MAG: HNH endonuclease signature motif containing protein [Brevundimonas sp.]
MPQRDLTADDVRRVLDYDPETGIFRWKDTPELPSNVRSRLAGRIAGSPCTGGYVAIKVGGRLYKAHRLAWLVFFGEWPSSELDHIDRRRAHNAIANLRLADRSTNMGNVAAYRSNVSGLKGVSKSGRQWRAQITKDRKTVNLGRFATREAAHAAYVKAANDRFGEFARAG